MKTHPPTSQKTRRTTRNKGEKDKSKETIKELKRIIAQLRKQLKKQSIEVENNVIDSDVEEALLHSSLRKENAVKLICNNCGSSNVNAIPAGVYTILQCMSCGCRKKKKDDRDETMGNARQE